MIKSNPVKKLLSEGIPTFGTWITLCPHPRIVKILSAAGFEFVIIEMEHTDFSFETVARLAMLAREAGVVPIVRPPGTLKPHDLTRPPRRRRPGPVAPGRGHGGADAGNHPCDEIPSARQQAHESEGTAYGLS